jgi:hypothetical protein
MLETCAHFRTMSAPDLASLLTRIVTVARATAIDPEAGPAVKLAEIMTFLDTVVAPPPPPPCEFPWRLAGRPGARGNDDGTGETMVTAGRRMAAGTTETHSPVPS